MSATPTVSYQVEPLDDTHDLGLFSCGESALDEYLKNNALKEAELKLSTTFAMVPKGQRRVVGYFSLSALHIKAGNLPDALKEQRGRYSTVPATLIGRLAVDQALQGQGFGRALLSKALKKCVTATATVASAMVIVDAKPDAVSFYEKNGFVLLRKPRRLYLPMKTVASAVASDP